MFGRGVQYENKTLLVDVSKAWTTPCNLHVLCPEKDLKEYGLENGIKLEQFYVAGSVKAVKSLCVCMSF